MEHVELLQVEDCFLIRGRGIVLLPDFSVPKAGWENCQEVVRLETPDGKQQDIEARIELTHFNISDPNATVDQRWRVVVQLRNTLEKPPVGSKVFASKRLHYALAGA